MTLLYVADAAVGGNSCVVPPCLVDEQGRAVVPPAMVDYHGETILTARPRPSREAMHRHVELLFGDARSGLIELSWLRQDSRGKRGARLFELDEFDELVEQALAWNDQGRNVYIGATLKRKDAPRQKATSDDDAMEAWSVWADFDEPGAATFAAERIRDHGRVPTALVTTGTVPHDRCHMWWRLEEPIADMAQVSELVSKLAAALGGDAKVSNPGRIMRLAGSIAWPTKPTRVAELTTIDARGAVLPTDAIGWMLGKLAQQPPLQAPRAASPPPRQAPQPAVQPVAHGLVEDGREEYMTKTVHAVGCELVGKTGAWPTADELFDVAWPQFERRTDLSRSGRITPANAQDEMRAKCAAWERKATAGGHGELAKLVERYHSRQRASAPPGATAGLGEASSRQEEVPADLAREFILRDTRLIPPRGWIYGYSYIRSFVSVLAASGGAGKTTLYVAEALSIATGKPLLGITPAERTGVWIMNLEDPFDEMERRIGAAAKYYGLDQSAIAGRLFVDAGRDKPLVVATQTRDGVQIGKPVVEAIVEATRRNGIGVLIVDPFVSSHTVNENDTNAVQQVVAEWRGIADTTGACVLLVHHLRKANGTEATVDSIRGSNAIVGAVRTARVLNIMSETEATKLGIEAGQRSCFVRLDDAKNNLAPPAARATWVEFVSVDLDNGGAMRVRDAAGSSVPLTLGGDRIGVATPWSPPDARALATIDHARAAIAFLAENGPQRASAQASEWFGHEVIRICGLSDDKKGLGEAKAILARWVEEGVLCKESRKSGRQGRKQPVYLAGTPSVAAEGAAGNCDADAMADAASSLPH